MTDTGLGPGDIVVITKEQYRGEFVVAVLYQQGRDGLVWVRMREVEGDPTRPTKIAQASELTRVRTRKEAQAVVPEPSRGQGHNSPPFAVLELDEGEHAYLVKLMTSIGKQARDRMVGELFLEKLEKAKST